MYWHRWNARWSFSRWFRRWSRGRYLRTRRDRIRRDGHICLTSIIAVGRYCGRTMRVQISDQDRQVVNIHDPITGNVGGIRAAKGSREQTQIFAADAAVLIQIAAA